MSDSLLPPPINPERATIEPCRERRSPLAWKLAKRFLVPGFAITLYYLLRDRAKVSPKAEVELSKHLRFGRGCQISSFVKIKAADGPLRLGANCRIGNFSFLSSGAQGLEIGDNLACGPNVTIMASSYNYGEVGDVREQGMHSKGTRIGHNVWIGAGTVILDGSVIGDNTIIAANSLVGRRYPPGVMLQGNPARIIPSFSRRKGGADSKQLQEAV